MVLTAGRRPDSRPKAASSLLLLVCEPVRALAGDGHPVRVLPIVGEQQAMIGITAIALHHLDALGNWLGGIGTGGTNLLVADPRDTPAFVRVLSKYKFASLPAVNTLFIGLLNDPGFAKLDFSKRLFGVGVGVGVGAGAGAGAATQRAVADQSQQVTSTPLLEGYGLTECSPTVAVNPVDLKEFSGGIGLPLPSTEVSIRHAEGRELAIGKVGEIGATGEAGGASELCVRGPQVMKGYWQRPKETAEVMTDDGFPRTGDMAVMAGRGFLKIVDRFKDMILVSGFNVYPNEIEAVVRMHPAVNEVAAVGKPSAGSGETVKIFVVKKSPELTEAMLMAHCRENFTAYKMPREVVFLDDLPKRNVGKILRRELRDRA